MLYWLTGSRGAGTSSTCSATSPSAQAGAFLTALVFGFVFGRPLIDLLRRKQGRASRSATTARSRISARRATPTMGGLLILSALLVYTMLWARLDNIYVWITVAVTVASA